MAKVHGAAAILRSPVLVFSLILLLLPSLSLAWYVNAKSSPSSGQGSVSPAGNVYVAGTTGTSATITVAPAPGYKVSRVTIDGVQAGTSAGSYTVPYVPEKSWRYVVAYFAPLSVSITTTAGEGGGIREADGLSLTGIAAGSTRTLIVVPDAGYEIASCSASGAASNVLNADGTRTITYLNLQANHSVSAAFSLTPRVTANAGSDVFTAGNGPDYTALLDGTLSSSNQGTISYAWSGPPELVFGTSTSSQTSVYSGTAGTYTATLKISSGAIESTDSASVTVPARASFLEGLCTSCHTTRNPAVVSGYDTSKHKMTGPDITVSCQTCHDPTDSKHYTLKAPTGVCQPCHAQIPTSTHATAEMADRCAQCHNPHSTRASCANCHGNAESGQIWPDGVANNPATEYAWADDAGSHAKHVIYFGTGLASCAACHPGTPPPGHFTDVTSGPEQAELIRMDVDGDGVVDLWRFAEGASATVGTAVYFGTKSGSDQDAWFDATTGSCKNIDCHSDGNYDSNTAAGGRGLGYRNPTWGEVLDGCDDCHGNGAGTAYPSYADGDTENGDANSHEIHVGTKGISCAECHSATAEGATSLFSGGPHLNRSVEILGAKIGGYASGRCDSISCHGGTSARWGNSACLDCHAVRQGNRAAVTGQFASASHHVQGKALSGKDCYQCHWEADEAGRINPAYHGGTSGASIDLVIYGEGARPSGFQTGMTAVRYTASGARTEIEKLNAHCLGCHSDQNNAADPFGDGKTPKQYAWDGSSVASRYSQSGTTPWGKYAGANISPKNSRAKAFSAHGNAVANEGGWDLNETWSNKRTGSVNVACFDCHNAHGSGAEGRTTSYASATPSGGLLKDVQAGVSGSSATYRPQGGGTAETKNQYNPGAGLCFDCHMNSTSGAERPWGYQSTFGAEQQVMGYFDSPYFGTGTTGLQLRFPYMALHKNAGGHFGASSPLSTTPMGTIDGLCTPCHDPHGVSPSLGANQPYGVPLLKGTWVTSPYKDDAAPEWNSQQSYSYNPYRIDGNTFGASPWALIAGVTQSDQQFAGLCLGCHPKGSLTDGTTHTWKSKERIHESVKGWKTTPNSPVKHFYTCSKCHAPHSGSTLPRLMVTDCLDSKHKGRTGGIPNPVVYGSGDGGSGQIPGPACHQGPSANNYKDGGLDQGWNKVTPWYVEPDPVITSGPSAGSFAASGSSARANVTWVTNVPSTSYVDFGATSAYGATAGSSALVGSHTVLVSNLANHSIVHYRVRSATYGGKQLASPDQTFYISLPPSVPTLTPASDAICAGNCAPTLSWNAASDPVDGGPVQYYAEASTTSNFSNIAAISGWVSGTAWTVPLPTNTIYYWRVRSRDASHATVHDPPSAWSASDSFLLSDGTSPQVTPTSPANGATDYGWDSYYWAYLAWSDVGAQTHAVPPSQDYHVQVSTSPLFTSLSTESPWIAASNWSAGLSTSYYSATTFYWRVQGRDSLGKIGPWSQVFSFTVWDQGASGSCPFLFTWDGEKYAFEADLFGAGKLGTKTSGGYLRPEPRDYYILKTAPALRNGRHELRLVEERLEVDYLDELDLYAVDVPADRLVFAEKFQAGSGIPPGQIPIPLHTVSKEAPPLRPVIHVNTGVDVTAKVAADDGDMLVLNEDRNIGFTYQTLELDLGDVSLAPQVKIVMDAVSLFPDTPEGIQRSGSFGARTILEVQDGTGAWVKVAADKGSLPKPPEFSRPYALDITNIWAGPSRKIRFTFLFKTYVDWIRVDTTADFKPAIKKLPMVSALLQEHGIDGKSSASEIYQYVYGAPNATRGYLPGSYTRYGDIMALLTGTDDKFVIFGGGDEIVLTFGSITPPLEGLERSFMVYTHGYYKDVKVDPPHAVEPLPFSGMSNFPYDAMVEQYPDDLEHQMYRSEYNTRTYAP